MRAYDVRLNSNRLREQLAQEAQRRRHNLNLTVRELADLVGMSDSAVSNMLQGRGGSIDAWEKLLGALRVEPVISLRWRP